MDRKIFNRSVAKNFKILSKNLKNRTTDFSEITFWEGVKGKDLSATKVASKMYDIIGCCATGVLPSVNLNGADGFFVGAYNKISEWEVKVCSVSKTSIFLGKRGGLYHSTSDGRLDPNRRSAITSKFVGNFDANMTVCTLNTKARNTALILFDEDDNIVIDVYMMDGDTVFKQLKNRRQNVSLSLKLSCFQINGGPLEDALPGMVGWEQWESQVVEYCKENEQYAY
jgi:hypothetical protein